ncbi:MAG: patatin-like phospholipase family protein [Clostridium sp.]
MDINLILEGGGALGISYLGSFKALVDKGFNIKKCAGTSIGALMSSLIMAGYSPGELEEIFFGPEFATFLKSSGLNSRIPPYKALNIFLRKGVFNSNIIEEFIEPLLAKKGIRTFGDVEKQGKNRLIIIGADITNRRLVVMPDDLPRYGIDPMGFKISTAVRMSCAIPLFFTPVVLNDKNKQVYIVDGGLLSNFPVWVFDVENEEKDNTNTIGIKIDEKPSNTSKGRDDIFSYTLDVLNTPLNDDRVVYVRNKDKLKIISIQNDQSIKSTEFYKLQQNKEHLYKLGYEAVNDNM